MISGVWRMLAFAAVVVCTWPAGADAAGWITPADVSLGSGGHLLAPQPDSVAMSPAGNLVVGWVSYDPTFMTPTIHLVLRPAGGPALTPQTYMPASSGTGSLTSLSVAVNDAGDAIAIWDNGGSLAYVVRAPGGVFGSPQLPPVFSFQNAADDPAVGLAADGTATVVYGARCTSGLFSSEAVAVRRTADGSWSAPEALATTVSCGDGTTFSRFRIDELPDGRAIVGFRRWPISGVPPPGELWSATRSSGTAAFSSQMLSSTNSPDAAAVAIESGGAALTAWSDTNGVQFNYHPRSGSDVPGGAGVATATSPQVAMGANGEALLVYANSSGAPGALQVAPNGSVVMAQTFLSGTGSQARPAVAADSAGRAIAVYRNNNNDDGLEALVRPPGGTFGNATKLGTGIADFPVVAADGLGDAALLWGAIDGGTLVATPTVRAYDGAAPQITRLSVPPVLSPGRPGTFVLAASDVWGPVSASWSFGDGATGDGFTIQHSFTSPRPVTVMATATDAAGNTASQSATTNVSDRPTATAGQIKASILTQIAPNGNGARIPALLKKGGYVLSFKAITAGTVEDDWYLIPAGAHLTRGKPKAELIATGRRRFLRAGTQKLTIELTAAGKRLLRRARLLRLTAKITFKLKGRTSVAASKAFTLRQ
jgi:PKD domain-containing protein